MHRPTCSARVKIPKEIPVGNTENTVKLELKNKTKQTKAKQKTKTNKPQLTGENC